MTKIARKLVTGLTILGLAAPALAATAAAPASTQVQVAQPTHHRTHRRVAQADQKKAATKKEAKASKKHAKASATKAEPAPAHAAAPAK